MKKGLYPKLSDMPYKSTKVSLEKSTSDIIGVLKKYGIDEYQWTQLEGKEYLKFIFNTIVQGKEVKIAVRLDLPEIKALKGRYNEVITIPKHMAYRMFFYSLKSLLETTQYGVLRKEDLFFSYIVTQLPDGSEGTLKDLYQEKHLLLSEKEE